ncbi:hypothetical protein DCAR_0103809 [Daucus carota subsp. sativus]|uniref:Uncharacterized protein n=1 Tax=Daucus carota subsp. sativus TaxID=79200 RepID=A0A166IAY0_DAUCS|nr:hypothetical protein DCAR_0103809 [Daucus carota subsp. sativus]
MLGSSRYVLSVQELVKDSKSAIPARYVHKDLEPVVSSSVKSLRVPVLDMNTLLDADSITGT